MSSEVYLHGEKVDTFTHQAELLHLYENRRHYSRDNRMPLTCTKPHRGHMYLRMVKDQLWAVHRKGEGSCRIRIGGEPESPEHLNMKHYAANALSAYPVSLEYSTGNGTVSDVYVEAPFPFSVEAQFSKLPVRDAKARTTKSTNAGAPPLWLPYGNPAWLSAVPTMRHNDQEITWERRPPKGTVPAIGLRRIVSGHCTVTGPFQHCPDKRSGFCGGWHPDYELVRGWTLDDVLVGTGERAVAFHQDRGKNVRVVLADTVNLYEELTGHTGLFTPGTRPAVPPAVERGPRECIAVRAPEFAYGDPCIRCHRKKLWHPESITRGICESCWIDIGRGANPFQLTIRIGAV